MTRRNHFGRHPREVPPADAAVDPHVANPGTLTPREYVFDLRSDEIDRRFYEALAVIKSSRQFTLDPHARNTSLEYPVRLGVRT